MIFLDTDPATGILLFFLASVILKIPGHYTGHTVENLPSYVSCTQVILLHFQVHYMGDHPQAYVR